MELYCACRDDIGYRCPLHKTNWRARATAAEAENAKLREALRTIALGISIELDAEDGPVETWLDAEELSAIARAALETNNG